MGRPLAYYIRCLRLLIGRRCYSKAYAHFLSIRCCRRLDEPPALLHIPSCRCLRLLIGRTQVLIQQTIWDHKDGGVLATSFRPCGRTVIPLIRPLGYWNNVQYFRASLPAWQAAHWQRDVSNTLLFGLALWSLLAHSHGLADLSLKLTDW